MARKAKTQAAVDATTLLDDPELAARHARCVAAGLQLDPKARWYKAKGGATLVMKWRGTSTTVIQTLRYRAAKDARR